jgi:hypothetical protein
VIFNSYVSLPEGILNMIVSTDYSISIVSCFCCAYSLNRR